MNDRVNWGRGRLRKYESIYSFFARFCYVNGLTPRQARDFVAQELYATEAIRRHYQRPNRPISFAIFLSSPDQIKKFAEMLDEPVGVIKALCSENEDLAFIPSMGTPPDMPGEEAALRYCDECAKDEYHGFFHEYRYLSLCPIHCSPLLMLSPSEKTYSRFERNVLALQSLYESSSGNWPVPPGSLSLERSRHQQAALSPFFRWCKTIRLTMERYQCATVWTSSVASPSGMRFWFEESRRSNALVWALNRAGIPSPVRGLLKSEPLAAQFSRGFSAATAHNLEKILQKISIDILLDVYRHWWAWTNRAKVNEQPVTELIMRLRSGHASCRCYRYRASTHERYICPYLHVANLLDQNWGELTEFTFKSNNHGYFLFEKGLEEISKHGFLDLAYDKIGCSRWPIPQREGCVLEYGRNLPQAEERFKKLRMSWGLSADVSELLDTIVSTELQVEIDILMEWALRISNGMPAAEVDLLPCCVTVVGTNIGLELMAWKAEH